MKNQNRRKTRFIVGMEFFLLIWMAPLAIGKPDKDEGNLAEISDDLDLLEMKVENVVTGMRRAQDVRDMPYAVSVITADDIRVSGSRSIPEALRLVPGMDVADVGYGNSIVSPRGFYNSYGSQTLIMVDGRQLYDTAFGGTWWGSWPFQLEDIERIEVIRGPAGVQWGANATNGVINIVTKDPAEQLGTTVTARGGSRGSNTEHLGHAFQDGKLRMRVSGEYEGSDGFNHGGSILRGNDDFYKTGRFGLYGIYDAGPRDTVTFSGGSDVADGIYSPAITMGTHLERPGSRANFVMGKWDHKTSADNSFQVTGYVNDFRNRLGTTTLDFQYQQFGLQFSNTLKPTENHTLVWGIDSRGDYTDASHSDPSAVDKDYIGTGTLGMYVEDEWRFAPKFALTTGGRIDYEFYGGFQPSAREALSYKPDDKSMVYGAVSRAFKMPNAIWRFMNVPMYDGLAYLKGDRDVDATTSLAYELGYSRKFFNRLDTKFNLYWNEFHDAVGIAPKVSLPELFYLNLQNIGNYSTYGAELEAKYAVTPKLTILGNYTFEMMDWRGSSGRFSVAADSIEPPKHKFMIGPRYSVTDNLRLSGQLWYVDTVWGPNPDIPFFPNHFDPYFRLDLRAEYQFWKKRAAVAVGVSNLLDPGHYEGSSTFYTLAEVPRMVYVELRITFK